MTEAKTTSFLVTLHPNASETEATVVRSALRAMSCVCNVSPVENSPAQDAARQQAKADLREELTPIFASLVQDVKGTLDATTEELVKITQPGVETPLDIAAEAAKLPRNRPQPVPQPLPQQRGQHRQPTAGTWRSVR